MSLVIRDFQGTVQGSQIVVQDYKPTYFTAEALACLIAVRLAVDLRLQCVIIEGDSLFVIRKLSDTQRDSLGIGPFIWDIKTLAALIPLCHFYMSRERVTR